MKAGENDNGESINIEENNGAIMKYKIIEEK